MVFKMATYISVTLTMVNYVVIFTVTTSIKSKLIRGDSAFVTSYVD